MELQDMKMMSSNDDNKEEVGVDEEEGQLPGFRFHPTDEELVSFYLKRKIQKRPISLEIIKQIDIYKHDPWELAKASSVGDKEWYFYCKRGRKYRNSSRPNRVITGSGFWKATGIDRPIYSNGGEGHQCVGLKKSLVYYRGSAGKGTKTEWMMHEFRLPTVQQHSASSPIDTLQEAEIWTLCRIFKRNRKYTPDWRQLSVKRASVANNSIISSKACSPESISNTGASYINFANPTTQQQQQPQRQQECYATKGPSIAIQSKEASAMSSFYSTSCTDIAGLQHSAPHSVAQTTPSDTSNFSSPLNTASSVDDQGSQFLGGYGGNWDDLSSVIEFVTRSPVYEQSHMYRP